jgi:cation transport ATPase
VDEPILSQPVGWRRSAALHRRCWRPSPSRIDRSTRFRAKWVPTLNCFIITLQALPFVRHAVVNLLAEKAVVSFRPESMVAEDEGVAKAVSAISKLGFGAELLKAVEAGKAAFYVDGMVCASCPPRIEAALGLLDGVHRCTASSSTSRLSAFRCDSREVGAGEICGWNERIEDRRRGATPLNREGLSTLAYGGLDERRQCGSLSLVARSLSRSLSLVAPCLSRSLSLVARSLSGSLSRSLSLVARSLSRSLSLVAPCLSRSLSGRTMALTLFLSLTLSHGDAMRCSVSADLVMEKVVATFDPAATGARDLMEALAELGYEPQLWSAADKQQHAARLTKQKEIRTIRVLFLVSLVLTAPVFLIMMVFMHFPETKRGLMAECVVGYRGPGVKLPLGWLVSAVLATPVQFAVGARFYTGAFRALRHGSANM